MFGVFPAHRVKSTNAIVRRLFAEYGASIEHAGDGTPVKIGDEAYVLFRNVGPLEAARAACQAAFKVAGDFLRLEPLRPSATTIRLVVRSGLAPELTPEEICLAVCDTEGIEIVPAVEVGCFVAPSAADAALLSASDWSMAVSGGATVVGFSATWEVDEEPAVVASPPPSGAEAGGAAVAPPPSAADPAASSLTMAVLAPAALAGPRGNAAVVVSAPHATAAVVPTPVSAPASVQLLPEAPPLRALQALPPQLAPPRPQLPQQPQAVEVVSAPVAPQRPVVPPSTTLPAARAPSEGGPPRRSAGLSPYDFGAVYILHDAASCPIEIPGAPGAAIWRGVVREAFAALCGLNDTEAAALDLPRLPPPQWTCVTRPGPTPRDEATVAAEDVILALMHESCPGFERVALTVRDNSIFAELKLRLNAVYDWHRDAAASGGSRIPTDRVGVVLVARHPEWHDAQLKSLVDAGFHVALIGLEPSAGSHLTPWQSRKEWGALVQSAATGAVAASPDRPSLHAPLRTAGPNPAATSATASVATSVAAVTAGVVAGVDPGDAPSRPPLPPLVSRMYSQRTGRLSDAPSEALAPPVRRPVVGDRPATDPSSAAASFADDAEPLSVPHCFRGDPECFVVVTVLPEHADLEAVYAFLGPAPITAIALSPPRSSHSDGGVARRKAFVVFADAESAKNTASSRQGCSFPGESRRVEVHLWSKLPKQTVFPPPSAGPFEYLLLGAGPAQPPRVSRAPASSGGNQRRVIVDERSQPQPRYDAPRSAFDGGAAAGDKRKRVVQVDAPPSVDVDEKWANIVLPGLK